MDEHEKSLTSATLVSSLSSARIDLINGGWPVPDFRIPFGKLQSILNECPRIAIEGVAGKKAAAPAIFLRKIIAGGIRMPHLHFNDEIYLLEKLAFKQYLQAAADEVENIADITDIGDFIRR